MRNDVILILACCGSLFAGLLWGIRIERVRWNELIDADVVPAWRWYSKAVKQLYKPSLLKDLHRQHMTR